jgi:hypothetical protein
LVVLGRLADDLDEPGQRQRELEILVEVGPGTPWTNATA